MHLAWRWFTGLGFEQEIPHPSTFSKNRHGRFQESNPFQELFERIVEQCMAEGLVEGEQMSVDGSFIMANASHPIRIPREQFTEAVQSDLPISPKATAISVLQASPSTTAAEVISTVP
jgi:hypothetical protein